MPELSLDDQERNPLAGHLNRIGVPQLVRCEPASDPGYLSRVAQLGTDSGRSA